MSVTSRRVEEHCKTIARPESRPLGALYDVHVLCNPIVGLQGNLTLTGLPPYSLRERMLRIATENLMLPCVI